MAPFEHVRARKIRETEDEESFLDWEGQATLFDDEEEDEEARLDEEDETEDAAETEEDEEELDFD